MIDYDLYRDVINLKNNISVLDFLKNRLNGLEDSLEITAFICSSCKLELGYCGDKCENFVKRTKVLKKIDELEKFIDDQDEVREDS